MTAAVVRPALRADEPRLTALMREFYAGGGLHHGPAVTAALAELLDDEGRGRAWLLEAGEEDAGYLILTWGYSLEFGGRFGLVDELYVRPAYRNAGLGTRALQAAAAACRRHGARAVRLEVDHGNSGAVRLYGRTGFTVHDRHIMTHRLEGADLPTPP